MGEIEDIKKRLYTIFNKMRNKESHRYYKGSFSHNENKIYDKKTHKVYDNITNEFEESDIDTYYEKITEEEYLKLYKNNICNCAIGSGNEIVISKTYNIIDVFEEITDKYLIKNKEYHSSRYVITEKLNDEPKMKFLRNKFYYQKACVKCKTCLDDKQELIEFLLGRIKFIEDKQRKEEMVRKICEESK